MSDPFEFRDTAWWMLHHECRDEDGTWRDRVLRWANEDLIERRWLECPACGKRAGIDFPPSPGLGPYRPTGWDAAIRWAEEHERGVTS